MRTGSHRIRSDLLTFFRTPRTRPRANDLLFDVARRSSRRRYTLLGPQRAWGVRLPRPRRPGSAPLRPGSGQDRTAASANAGLRFLRRPYLAPHAPHPGRVHSTAHAAHAQLGVRCVAKLDLAESGARFFLSSSRRKKRASHSSFADERIQSENHGGQPPRIISLQARVEHQAMGAKLEGRQAGGRAHLGRGWDLASVKAAAELDEVSLLLGGGLSTHRCMQTTQRVCMGTRYSTGCVATRQTVGCVQDG